MKKSIAFIFIALATLLNAQTIQKIEFKNLSRISTEIASETANIGEGDTLDIKKINKAIKQFYKFGYFDDIEVIDNNGILEFIFKEKPSIANVEMNGYKSRQEDIQEVIKRVGLSKGTMYTKSKIQQAKKALLTELQLEGYVNSVVEIEVEKLNESSVTLTIEVNKGDEIILKKVNYHGAVLLNENDFESITANKEKDSVSWWFGRNNGEAQIEQLPYEHLRITELYLEHGFLDSVVKPPFLKVDFSSNEAKLDFFINEGPQYKVSKINIFLDTSILDPKTLYSKLQLKKDVTLNIKSLRSDSDYIKTQVANLGYAFAQVQYDIKKDTANNKAEVIFSVIPGKKVYINDVFISGNTKTLDRIIRRDIYLSHGDLFSLTDYKDSISKLKRSGFFEDITIDQKRISEDKMDLSVKVKEVATGSLILGGGYGSYDGFIINASFSDRNIFGSGLNLGLAIDTSDRQNNYSLSLSNPSIKDSPYNGKIQVYNRVLDIDQSTDFGTYELEREASGFTIGAGKELIRNFYAGLDYKLETVEEQYIYAPGYDSAGFQRPNQDYFLSSLTSYISFNNTDDFYFPSNGFKAGVSLEYAGIGGDAKYLESSTYLKYFYPLGDLIGIDTIFRYRGQVRVITNNGFVPFGSSLYMGGPKSLRGYESFAFGADYDNANSLNSAETYKYNFTNGVELNFPLIPSAKMRWGIFYDYGMIGIDSFDELRRSGTGVLIEWISPVGPIQFIFSSPLDDEPGDQTSSFEFSLGTSF